MDDPIAVALQFGFLAVLYLFLIWVTMSAKRDLSHHDITVDDPFASSAHARIFPRGQFMYIEDMGSTNGTFLNGRQVRSAERLKPADTIRIGDTEYRYQE